MGWNKQLSPVWRMFTLDLIVGNEMWRIMNKNVYYEIFRIHWSVRYINNQGLVSLLIFTPKLLVYDAISYSVCKVGNNKEYNDVKTILDS
jgi:hypothetical protein